MAATERGLDAPATTRNRGLGTPTVADLNNWSKLVAEFNALGGKVKNVLCRRCPHGQGLFVIDPSKQVEIDIPEKLLVQSEHVALLDGYPCIVGDVELPDGYIGWFHSYQKQFGWTEQTRASLDKFERGLTQLPVQSLRMLESMGLLNLEHRHQGPWQDVIFRQYVHTRSLLYYGRRVIIPIADMVNHHPLARPYQIFSGVRIQGLFHDEVLTCYNESDPLGRFFKRGFPSAEPRAYRYPAALPIDRDQRRAHIPPEHHGYRISASAMTQERADHAKHKRIEAVALAHGHNSSHRHYSGCDLNELYDDVHRINHYQLCQLFDSLSGFQSPCAKGLRQAIIYQLKALDRCVRVIVY